MRLIFEPSDRVIVCNPKLKTFNKIGTVIRKGQVNFTANEYTFGVKLDKELQTRYYDESSLKLAVPEVQPEMPDVPRALPYDKVEGNYYNGEIKNECDCSNLDLSEQNLIGEIYHRVNFNGCIMPDVSGSVFYDCSFFGATFTSVESAEFYYCNMENSTFTEGVHDDAEFEDCNLRGATLSGYFHNAVFGYCDLEGAIAGDKLNLWGVMVESPKEDIPVIKVYSNLNSCYDVTFMGDHIQIGCKGFTRKDWENFTNRDIIKFDGRLAVAWWNDTKEEVFKLHDEYLAQFKSELPVPPKRVKYKGTIGNYGNYSNMDLSECKMHHGSFFKCKFSNSILPCITNSNFKECEMDNVVFTDDALGTEFDECNLQNAVFRHRNFEDSKFFICDMRNATFAGNFRDATITKCNLEGAKLAETPAKFKRDDCKTSFRGVRLHSPVESVPVLTERVYIGHSINEYSVSFFRDHIQIGCKGYTRKEWENFNDEQIENMDCGGALEWWNKYKTSILKMHDEYLAKHN